MVSYSRYWQGLREQAARLTVAYTLSFAVVGFGLLMPWPLKYLVDDVLTGQTASRYLVGMTPTMQVLLLAAVMLLIAVGSAIVSASEKVCHAQIREQFGLRLRDQLVRQLYGLSRFSRQVERSGELTMRLTGDVQQVSRLFCKTLPTGAKHVGTALFTLVAMTFINPLLGTIALVLALTLAVVVRGYGPSVNAAAKNKRQMEGKVAALTQENVRAVEHVQSMGLEAQSRARYLHGARASLRAGVDEVRQSVKLERTTQFVGGFALAGIAATGGLMVLQDTMTLGMLTVCLAYMNSLLKPVEKINELSISVVRGWARLLRLQEVFAAPQSVVPSLVVGADAASEIVAVPQVTQLECDKLSFCYPGSCAPTIGGFSHRFRRGEMTAIVGPSGSGKSTLVSLLLRLLPPSSGKILANDVDYNRLDPSQLRSQFAVVLQDSHLFTGSIREVLTELSPQANDEKLWQALTDVQLVDLVESLPSGLDTALDESASQVSGGQRARLLLARALLGERSVLVLDEPLANIDSHSQQVITRLIEVVKRRCIVIAVTHESQLLKVADHLLEPVAWDAQDCQREATNV